VGGDEDAHPGPLAQALKPVRLSREADAEAEEAAVWYDGRQAGLGTEFLEELDRMTAMIAARPESFPRLLDVPGDDGVRRALLPRFPYAIVFTELAEEIRVLAVAHGKRRPGYWLYRVRE
jgi:plasmid stabilization system protein ParE